jgi:hypothetical protein
LRYHPEIYDLIVSAWKDSVFFSVVDAFFLMEVISHQGFFKLLKHSQWAPFFDISSGFFSLLYLVLLSARHVVLQNFCTPVSNTANLLYS